jgi:hypothetical protein
MSQTYEKIAERLSIIQGKEVTAADVERMVQGDYLIMPIIIDEAANDIFDVIIPSFHHMTTAEHLRICDKETDGETVHERLLRITGAKERFIKYMKLPEAEGALNAIEVFMTNRFDVLSTLNKAKETLDNWEKEHEGKVFTVDDARDVLMQHGVLREWIETPSGYYKVIDVDKDATFGQWVDLTTIIGTKRDAHETEVYVDALAHILEGPYPVRAAGEDDDTFMARASKMIPRYPVERDDETAFEYEVRRERYLQGKRNDMLAARYIDVIGAAAFFFTRSERFAHLLAPVCPRLLQLRPQWKRPEVLNLPDVGDLIRS